MKFYSLDRFGRHAIFDNKAKGESLKVTVDGSVAPTVGDAFLKNNASADSAVTSIFDERVQKLAALKQAQPEAKAADILGPEWQHKGKFENTDWYQLDKGPGEFNQVLVDEAEVKVAWQLREGGRVRHEVSAQLDQNAAINMHSMEESIELEDGYILRP